MAIQLIPLIVVIVGGAATVGAGAYAYKSYKDAQETKPPVALVQPEAKPENEKPPKIEIVQPQLPQFHVLRVEEDGFAVIAGSAPANSLVEIIHGEKVIATTKAGANGDFAIVFDKPLEPGIYELYIRATIQDGNSVVSAEAGIINIPERGGELIAMVTKPGEASKLIQVPQSESKPEPKPEPVVKVEPEPEPVVKVEPEPVEIAKVEPEPVVKIEPEPAPEPVVKVEPEPAPEPVVKVEPQPQAKPEPVEVVSIPKPEPAPKPEPVIIAPVLLGAVEVEGSRLFIAGTGEPGRIVNLYIDNKYLGEAIVNSQGSFLLEANLKLAYGDHTVRADMLAKASAVVIARAEVPLIHDAPPAPEPVIIAKAPEPEPEKVVAPEPKPAIELPAAEISKPEPVVPAVPVAKVVPVAPVVKVVPAAPATPAVTVAPVVPVVVEPPKRVIRTGSSVIIRRGDNLWRISRRILGRGIRYSTIYNANREQIKNPDLIFPGQIFKIPKKTANVESSQEG